VEILIFIVSEKKVRGTKRNGLTHEMKPRNKNKNKKEKEKVRADRRGMIKRKWEAED